MDKHISLSPCPFCGGVAQVINTWTMHGITGLRCSCSNPDCPNSVRTVALATWNTRPIEDELETRIAELELSSIQIEYMNEDELPADLSDDVYSAMYECSKIDFVRLFPFVTVDGDKCFLIKLPEVQE